MSGAGAFLGDKVGELVWVGMDWWAKAHRLRQFSPISTTDSATSLKHQPAVFRRHFYSIQQCVHKRARVKRTQIVYAFAYADVADRNWAVGGKGGKDTAFGRTV